MRPGTPLIAAACLCSALPALAAAPRRPLPELRRQGVHAFRALCAVPPISLTELAPDFEPDPRGPEQWRKDSVIARDRAKNRVLLARRAIDEIEAGARAVARETNECETLWARMQVLRSTAAAAVREAADSALRPYVAREAEVWKQVPLKRLSLEAAGDPARPSAYSEACRAPAVDAVFFVPAAPALAPSARKKLALIGASAARVSAALLAQKKAFDELLRLTDARACRELMAAFDALVADERTGFYVYREDAVAAAVWDELEWTAQKPGD